MTMKKSQLWMVGLLPLIVVGGLFFPLLGYLVLAMMIFFIPLSFFKGRFWCWHLCPRGAFLDIFLSRVSAQHPVPKVFLKTWFRWVVFIAFMSFLVVRILQSGGSLIALGAVFVTMCIITTLIAVILGVPLKHRSWCMICPMGTLQETLGKIKEKKKQ